MFVALTSLAFVLVLVDLARGDSGIILRGTLKTGGGQNIYSTPQGALWTASGCTESSVSTEVLVLNVIADGGVSTGTAVPASPLSGRKALEICNYGPNTIDCTASGATVTESKAREVPADTCWALDCSDTACPAKCRARTADQATGNATVATECR